MWKVSVERYVSISCLGKYFPTNARAFDALREVLMNDPHELMRRDALSTFGEYLLADARTLLVLRECAEKDASARVRAEAQQLVNEIENKVAQV